MTTLGLSCILHKDQVKMKDRNTKLSVCQLLHVNDLAWEPQKQTALQCRTQACSIRTFDKLSLYLQTHQLRQCFPERPHPFFHVLAVRLQEVNSTLDKDSNDKS